MTQTMQHVEVQIWIEDDRGRFYVCQKDGHFVVKFLMKLHLYYRKCYVNFSKSIDNKTIRR
jgi:hypothetical protein